MKIEKKLASILFQISGIKEEEIKPEVELKSLGLDSIDKMEFFMEIEEEFEIIESNWDECKTIGDIVEIIRQYDGEPLD